jgi:hypothetical protein
MAIQEESRTPSETPDVSQVRHPEVSHETADVNVRGVQIFIAVLVVVVAALCVGMWWLLKAMSPRPDVPRQAVEPGRPLPPPPRLLGAPGAPSGVGDMKALRRAEDAVLGSYGWVDPEGGVVRVPIQRAMELLLQRGLPVGPEASAPWEYVPSETSSGQALRRRDP